MYLIPHPIVHAHATNEVKIKSSSVTCKKGYTTMSYSASQVYSPPVSHFETVTILPFTSSLAMHTDHINVQPIQSTAGFPSVILSQFMLYLIQFCPGQTSTCFKCGNPLKQDATNPETLNNLVIVSKLQRKWMFGRTYSKISNVTFIATQPAFDGNDQIFW